MKIDCELLDSNILEECHEYEIVALALLHHRVNEFSIELYSFLFQLVLPVDELDILVVVAKIPNKGKL